MWWRLDKGVYEVERLANAEQASLRTRPPVMIMAHLYRISIAAGPEKYFW